MTQIAGYPCDMFAAVADGSDEDDVVDSVLAIEWATTMIRCLNPNAHHWHLAYFDR